MDGRWGLGPVFAAEWRAGSRSPRIYAVRAGFVLTLLAVLVAVWCSEGRTSTGSTLNDFAEMGAAFFLGLVGAQMALILLVAPAATAGSICLDRSRGSLTHLLVTDLSDPEIVLGKLAARLVPTLSLVLCALPVQFLASLLGGIDPLALIGSTVITWGVGLFACTLALAFSVWGRKTQEVLLATYAVLLVWLLAYPVALGFGLGSSWPWRLDPFQLALAPYTEPGSTSWLDTAIFAGLMLALSAGLLLLTVWKFRSVSVKGERTPRRRARREWRALRRFRPALDADPILWREWHRARPSRWTRAIWWVYYALASIFGVVAIARSLYAGTTDAMALFVVAFGSSIGLLLLTVDSATSLAEERARGSLDVLMTTPLSTRSIVWGKWRGAFGRVLGLAIMPALVTLVCKQDDDRWFGATMTLGLILAYGAAITSLGLALATWIRRLGRAVATSVGIYLLITTGLFFVCFTNLIPDNCEDEFAVGSPFYGPAHSLEQDEMQAQDRSHWYLAPAWILAYSSTAGLLLFATLATFDRSLGRARSGTLASAPRLARRLHRGKRRPFAGPSSEIASHALEK